METERQTALSGGGHIEVIPALRDWEDVKIQRHPRFVRTLADDSYPLVLHRLPAVSVLVSFSRRCGEWPEFRIHRP
jgi:hypothetical protein